MVSLGCPKNTVDGEVLLGDLFAGGFDVAPEDGSVSDAIVVNTCAFVEDARQESLEAIEAATEAKRAGRTKRVIVTGCLAQRYAAEVQDVNADVDVVMGFEKYSSLPDTLRAALAPEGAAAAAAPGPSAAGAAPAAAAAMASPLRVQVGEATVPFRPEWGRHRLTPAHSAYLRVAEGCDHACTFCAIPGFRGKFRSKPWDAVLQEARALAASGVRELNLIAEDTNQYGSDRRGGGGGPSGGRGLAELLKALAAIEGIAWIRLLYCYPSYFTDDLISVIAEEPKVCKYIDMPLQHLANRVLLCMNRPPQQHTEALLSKLRERIPGLALRTTFICGFPGETKEDHRELVAYCRAHPFERMGAFTFSAEDGTPAAEYPEQVKPRTRERRRDELVSLQQDLSAAFAQGRVGSEADILIDRPDPDGPPGTFLGRTQLEAPDVDPVVFVAPPAEGSGLPPLGVGQLRRCRISGSSVFDLEAYPIA